MHRPIRIAHLPQEQDYREGYAITKDEVTLYRYLPPERYVQASFTNLAVPEERKRDFRDEFGVEIYDGISRFDDLVEVLRGHDVAVIHHYLPHPRALVAASAAGIPVIVERVLSTFSAQEFGFITWTVCIGKNVFDLQPQPDRCSIVYNGIDLNRYSYDRPLPPANRRLVIAQVASEYDCDVPAMRELVKRLRAGGVDVEAWVVGFDGPSDGDIRYLGWRNDVPELLREIDVLLHFAPRDEAFGYMVVEALAAGVIPVVADAFGPGEIVEHGVSGFKFPRGDVGQAARWTKQMAEWTAGGEPDLKRMIDCARRRADDFDERVIAGQYDGLFSRLVLQARSAPVSGREEIGESSGVWHDVFDLLAKNWHDRFFAQFLNVAEEGFQGFPVTAWLRYFQRQIDHAPRSFLSPLVAHFFMQRINRIAANLAASNLQGVAYELGLWALFLNRKESALRMLSHASVTRPWADLLLRCALLEISEYRETARSGEGRGAICDFAGEMKSALRGGDLESARGVWSRYEGERWFGNALRDFPVPA